MSLFVAVASGNSLFVRAVVESNADATCEVASYAGVVTVSARSVCAQCVCEARAYRASTLERAIVVDDTRTHCIDTRGRRDVYDAS